MTETMNKTIIKWGWLVMAAALTFGFTACSNNDDVIDEQPQQPAVRTIQVTIGADIDNSTTRATTTYANEKYTMAFTTDDILYVDTKNGSHGELTCKSIDGDGKAHFSGTVTLKDGDNENLQGFRATLIPNGKYKADGGSIVLRGDTAAYVPNFAKVTTTAGETMTDIINTHAYVYGKFTDGTKNVTLSAKSAFIEFKVKNTTGSTAFSGDYNVKVLPLNNDAAKTVTANSDNELNFVAWLEVKPFPFLLVEIGSDKKVFVEGKGNDEVKEGKFAAKHYTLSTTAETRNELSVSGSYMPTPSTGSKAYSYSSESTNPANFTLIGEGMQYTFALNKTGDNKVTFGYTDTNNKNKGIAVLGDATFMTCAGDLTIDLIGTTNIRVANADAIHTTGALKLSCGNLTSATLIVTIKADTDTDVTNAKKYRGLYGSNYTGETGSNNASALAAANYSVSRTGYDNGDGTYTFRYKVKKN